MLELYESIRGDDIPLENEQDQNFADLMHRLLEKDPEKRITMPQLRVSRYIVVGKTPTLY
jgi:[calcium/calmodulin-dependent protein kinase] kinase